MPSSHCPLAYCGLTPAAAAAATSYKVSAAVQSANADVIGRAGFLEKKAEPSEGSGGLACPGGGGGTTRAGPVLSAAAASPLSFLAVSSQSDRAWECWAWQCDTPSEWVADFLRGCWCMIFTRDKESAVLSMRKRRGASTVIQD